ncbi:hypothetical protein [Enterobacter asburiae]|uniref:hypothetical protein n=1 Tax=Enterobacter asburiae TaxID=61645 RepID=UPI002005DB6E|nr:hypothetical protein [Enterobacter asburiae]MCK6677645.1 hypothetical protein [Enterobacter asburiae]
MTTVANKHVARVGHEFAAAMTADTPIIEIAKMVSRLANALDEQTALVAVLSERFAVASVANVSLINFIKTDCYVAHFEPETFYEAESTRYVSADGYEPEQPAISAAITDIISERQRQQSVEGWTPQHDDEHCTGALARAAVCYASHAGNPHNKNMVDYQKTFSPARWPWSEDWWKPTNPRRDLVKAGALIAAEIERLDRASGGEVQS